MIPRELLERLERDAQACRNSVTEIREHEPNAVTVTMSVSAWRGLRYTLNAIDTAKKVSNNGH